MFEPAGIRLDEDGAIRRAARLFGVENDGVLRTGAALEMIHCYSLVHDDLPAMDDDDLRRGLPTCHKKFGDALAILAGDGLLTLAFQMLTGLGVVACVRDIRASEVRGCNRSSNPTSEPKSGMQSCSRISGLRITGANARAGSPALARKPSISKPSSRRCKAVLLVAR